MMQESNATAENTEIMATQVKKSNKSKKKRKLLILIVAMAVLVAGEAFWLNSMKKDDIRFVSAVENTISKASKLESYGEGYAEITQDEWKEIFALEYDGVQKYESIELRNSDLNELKNEYIEALKECKTAVTSSDPQKKPNEFWKNFLEPYMRSCKAVVKLKEGDYGVDFNNKTAKNFVKKLKIESWLYDYFLDLKQAPEKKGSKNNKLVTEINNTSGYKIDNCEIELILLDSKDRKIGNASAYVDDWVKGETREIEFPKIPNKCKKYRINYIQYNLQ